MRRYQVGDRVAIEPTIPCNRGHYNLCHKLIHIGGSLSGGFAEYMVAPESKVYHLPDQVSFEAGALAEVYAVAVHALAMTPVQPSHWIT